ncbi:hypothetical protein HY732_03100 [Candidatus Uhrbacteria bacterium]|nr:hypothetical protein [Candidatus Uhrbacteria bacterium]
MGRTKSHTATWKVMGVLVVIFSLFSSPIALAAISCSGVVFPATSDTQCSSYCSAGGAGQSASWNMGGYSGAGGSGNCCCTGGTWTSGSSSSGSRAATPGAATPVTSGRFGYANVVDFENPLPSQDVPILVGNVIRAVLGVIGSIALVIFLYGGMQWMVAMGDESKVKKGWETMLWAGLGMIIIFGSYVAVQLLLKAVLGS